MRADADNIKCDIYKGAIVRIAMLVDGKHQFANVEHLHHLVSSALRESEAALDAVDKLDGHTNE